MVMLQFDGDWMGRGSDMEPPCFDRGDWLRAGAAETIVELVIDVVVEV
jgi:hypothetical protein